MTKKALFSFSIKDIAEIAIFVALAIVIDTYVKIPTGSTGGSINFSVLPLMIVALRHGPFKAFIASGIIYGLITCLIDGYGFITYPLEYLIAFGSVAIFGFISPYVIKNFNKDVKGKLYSVLLLFLATALWSTIRFFAGSIDSVLLWEATWSGAFIYNASYVYPSALLDYILIVLVMFPMSPLFMIYPTNFTKELNKEIVNNEDIEQ